jgi:molecular chaperone GrpE
VTNEPQANESHVDEVDSAGSAAAGPAGPRADTPSDSESHDKEPEQPPIVIRDKRRIDPNGPTPKPPAAADTPATTHAPAGDAKPAEQPVTATDKPATTTATEAAEANQELDTLRHGLDELTRDLQRVTAEYANYRKRVDRDRAVVTEQATGAVLTQLLPVLDDLDRARNHGDLVGPFASVADQLSTALGKFGLTAFGDVGDPFDPTLHEAVSHTSSPDVTETACVEIMRRGYLLGERLLRPALVAVADPE